VSTRHVFIPLKREHFEAFAFNAKDRGPNGFMEEYRLAGKRWNASTCPVGARVTLSLGYGKAHRLGGRVAGYRESLDKAATPTFCEIYGPHDGQRKAACIEIEMDAARVGEA